MRFIDIRQEIAYTKTSSEIRKDDSLLPRLFEYLFEEESVDKAIFIKSGFIFDKSILEIENGVGFGYEIYTKTDGYETIIKPKLDAFRSIASVSNHGHTKYWNNMRLPVVSDDSKWSCSIKVRSELVFSGLLQVKERESSDVALLIPVKNENGRVEECALLKYLIPSLGSYEKMTIYVGYDVGDPVLKHQANRDYIKKRANVKLFELPKTGWLTFIWNYLFVEAYADGNKYFVQLNDDVKFFKDDWLKSSISLLKEDDMGVVGFNDAMWQCKLYTQTLVNRHHYKTFRGQYFPLSLRNWYSDNWITLVYDKRGGKCNHDALISNGNVATRYDHCDARNLKSALAEGKKLLLLIHAE